MNLLLVAAKKSNDVFSLVKISASVCRSIKHVSVTFLFRARLTRTPEKYGQYGISRVCLLGNWVPLYKLKLTTGKVSKP